MATIMPTQSADKSTILFSRGHLLLPDHCGLHGEWLAIQTMLCKQRLLPGLVALYSFLCYICIMVFPTGFFFPLTHSALLPGFSLTLGRGHTQYFLYSPGSTSPPPGFSAGMSTGPLPLSAHKQWNLDQAFLRLAFYPPGYSLAPCRLDISCMAVSRPVFFVDCNPRSHINPDPLGLLSTVNTMTVKTHSAWSPMSAAGLAF